LVNSATIFDRDPLATEFDHERIGVRRISKAEPDVIGRWIAAQIGVRILRYGQGHFITSA
jgi:hypothetical protein